MGARETWSKPSNDPNRARGEQGATCPIDIEEPQLITEWKGRNLTPQQREFNTTIQHYRGRVELLISEVVDGRAALCTTWRGSFSLLAAIMKSAVHMVGLQERMKGRRVRPMASVPAAHCRPVPLSGLFLMFVGL